MDLKKVFIVGTAGFVVVCFGLFLMMTRSFPSKNIEQQSEVDFHEIKVKLDRLKSAFEGHQDSMKGIEAAIAAVDSPQGNNIVDDNIKLEQHHSVNEIDHGSTGKKNSYLNKANTCSAAFSMKNQARSDINMLEVYEFLKFDNPNGGSWKQGWDVQIDSSRFSEVNKLKVFVIPHSHNDPGWIKTFERYYVEQTKHILDTMLRKLGTNPSLKFIWAEISYFSMWWNDLHDGEKNVVKKLIENHQLEFVTGGWVMPDEANSHYYSILLQLIEGHQWLYHHLEVIPKNGWSIDPFGMSPTNAYFLKRTGINNMVIQRTHYSVKKYLSQLKELEFKWRQLWDADGKTDIVCHMMPFYSYDVPHTCGPDPKVCCQFDFKRMRGVSSLSCPWRVPPKPIVARNVHERSSTLVDQYKKKAMLYKTNTLLIPLGDDFRWENSEEWDAQTKNYAALFEYINNNPEFETEIKFGTLEDYFSELNKEISSGNFKPSVLTGDFFSYADRDDHYWTGYFTSRPFHKAMDRELITHLRSANILYSVAAAELSKKYGNIELPLLKNLLGDLIAARRNLSLFQHHDGVTGTSKDHVMVDYANKLFDSLGKCNNVMQQCLYILTKMGSKEYEIENLTEDSVFYEPTYFKEQSYTLPHYNRIVIDRDYARKLVTVFNSVARRRTMLVNVYVSTYRISVSTLNDEEVDFEIYPVFDDKTTISKNRFHLCFVAEMDSLEVRNYKIQFSPDRNMEGPKIYMKNAASTVFDHEKFPVKLLNSYDTIHLSNDHMKLNFNEFGFLDSVNINGRSRKLNIKMHKYGIKNRPESSGLYLFIPDGNAEPIEIRSPFIKVIEGRLQSFVEVWYPQVKHRIRIFNHPGFEKYSIDIENTADIRNERNFELMMRFSTDVDSGAYSYTDLNGFHMIKRERFAKLPLQANFYPLPSATYIEDEQFRFTVLTKQPLGTASLSSGEIEVILDRRILQDDNRGAGQGDTDNIETTSRFKIMLEPLSCQDKDLKEKAPMLSLQAHLTSEDLLHPFQSFVKMDESSQLGASQFFDVVDYKPSIGDRSAKVACDIRLLDASMLPVYSNPLDDRAFSTSSETAILIHRVGFDGRFLDSSPISGCSLSPLRLGRFRLDDLFGSLYEPQMKQATLSFVHEGKSLAINESILMKPMEVYGFLAGFRDSEVHVPSNEEIHV